VGLATAGGLAEIAAGVMGTAATSRGRRGSRRQAVERLGQRRRLRAWSVPARGRPVFFGGRALRCLFCSESPSQKENAQKKTRESKLKSRATGSVTEVSKLKSRGTGSVTEVERAIQERHSGGCGKHIAKSLQN
jgi:hypothetical protein